jgi:hypothetical protein
MANYSQSDPEYWDVPEKYLPLVTGNTNRRAAFFVLGEIEDREAPMAAILEMPAGYVIPRHAHDAERFEVVVKGSIDVGDRILYPGDVMIARPGELYGPKVCGPDGCTTVEFFSSQRGVDAPLVHELTDGTTITVDYLRGERPPANVVGLADAPDRVVNA